MGIYQRHERKYVISRILDELGYRIHIENEIMKIIRGALIMKAENIPTNLYMLLGVTLQEVDASFDFAMALKTWTYVRMRPKDSLCQNPCL